ncbi:cell wall-active antibiotics response protein [Paenibacillus sp. 7124]|uniref:Cell wall-active antibiotics response protein n=1 Tax=Paenibacillus apii TaxID=1850370 RepID=A0A6M1PLX5_9BACL|nr:cell wall-active antibiotics response protein LiaF [Paenibacillus apii]NGM84657.1 cell wall-active antibiotics response protein [Paenibacillus apii]NJJ41274.1 cell wall-active antibiotics response protein [Paenibacillus apii]
MEKRNRLIAIGLIAVGCLMIFGRWIGFLSIVALLLLLLGIFRTKSGKIKQGYTLLGIGAVLLLLDHLVLVLGICLISLGMFFVKSKGLQQGRNHLQKQNFSSSFNWDRSPWVMHSLSAWHVLGETDLDLSLAMAEDKETVMLFQGIFGDVDLHLADGYGVEIDAFVLFGSIEFGSQRDAGMMNRLNWKSPGFESSEHRVKVSVSYLMGDLDVRLP